MSEETESTAAPDYFDVFTPEYCQAVFQYFEHRPTEPATVTDLGTYISEQYRSNKDETDIAVFLHHSTLPKLADAGLIEYDPRSQTARYTGFNR